MSTVIIEDSGLRKSYVSEITKRQKLETMPRDYDVIQTFPFDGFDLIVAASNYRPHGEVQLVYPLIKQDGSHA